MSAAAPAAAPAVDTAQANTDYMMRSRRFPVRMLTIGGNLSGTYTLGTTLNFIMPPVNNGWLESIELDVNLSLADATAAVAANPNYPWGFIQGITVNLDGQISYVEPYASYLLAITQNRLGLPVNSVPPAPFGSNTNLSNILMNLPTWAVGNNVVRFRIRIPLNALHPLDGSGLLPCQGTQDPVQINVLVPNALVGNDPYNFPTSSGTGTLAVNAGSVVNCWGWVRDGRTKWAPGEQLPYYPDGLPQVSYDREPDVINLQAGQIVRGQLTKVLKMYYMWVIGIDGVSATQFSSNTNWNSYDLSADSTGNFKFMQYGLENIPIEMMWEETRDVFEQDFPQGVLPLVYAPQRGLPEIGVGNANDVLNMMAGGWTSLYQGVNFAATGANAAPPRLHTIIVGANDSPYIG